MYGIVDMQQVKWNYNSEFVYNGKEQDVKLLDVPSGITVTYSGTSKESVAGEYTVRANLYYDSDIIQIKNNNFNNDLVWKISKAKINLHIDDKSSKYGETIQTLTHKLVSGTLYSNRDVITLRTKDFA